MNTIIVEIMQNLASLHLSQEELDDFVAKLHDQVLGNGESTNNAEIDCKMIHNMKRLLQVVKLKEHQSGLFQSLVGSLCGANVTNTAVAKRLEINRHSVGRAKRKRLDFETEMESKYEKYHKKPIIKRTKVPITVQRNMEQWLESAFTASSNTKNVVQYKDKATGEWTHQVKHWRTDTLDHLYDMCCIDLPEVQNHSRSYFISLIPPYVKMRYQYSGLCTGHNIGLYYGNLLLKCKKLWHPENCACKCKYCTICSHGKTPVPSNKHCHFGTCTQCCNDECPVEWDESIEFTWNEKSYQKVDGKLESVEQAVTSTREFFSSRITDELNIFNKHETHVNWFKSQWKKLQRKLRKNHLIIRWDFIGMLLIIKYFLIK
jgi:hypothetical protein